MRHRVTQRPADAARAQTQNFADVAKRKRRPFIVAEEPRLFLRKAPPADNDELPIALDGVVEHRGEEPQFRLDVAVLPEGLPVLGGQRNVVLEESRILHGFSLSAGENTADTGRFVSGLTLKMAGKIPE